MKRIITIFGLMLLLTGCIFQSPYKKEEFKIFFNEKLKLREELIDELKKENSINYNGVVILEDKYNEIAYNNKVSTAVCNQEECIVSFLYKPGFPDEAQYLVYTTKNEELIEEYIGKSNIGYIKIVEDNWYFVQCN